MKIKAILYFVPKILIEEYTIDNSIQNFILSLSFCLNMENKFSISCKNKAINLSGNNNVYVKTRMATSISSEAFEKGQKR